MKTVIKTLAIASVMLASGGVSAASAASTGTQELSFCEQVSIQTEINQTRLSTLTTTINSFVSYLMYGKETDVTVGEFAGALQLYGTTADNLRLLEYAKGAYCFNPVLPVALIQ